MQTHRLVSHPAFMPGGIESVAVRWGLVGDGRVMLRYRIDGGQGLVTPPAATPERADELWQSTCCELFLAMPGGAYREFNFSPSSQWAAYEFAGYRNRIGNFDPVRAPEITLDRGASVVTLTAFIDLAELTGIERVSLSAVLEEGKGRKSYWAARHPDLKPDFHNPACFVLPVGPAEPA